MFCKKYDKDSAEGLVRYHQLKNVLMKRFEALQKKYKLKKSELLMMAALMLAEEENTSTELGKIIGMNKAQVSKTLDSLTKQGYVSSKTDEKDRRYVHYFISDEGQILADEIYEVWEFLKGNLFKDVSEEDIKVYFTVTKQMQKNIYDMSIDDN